MKVHTEEKDGKKRVDVKLTNYESRAADDALKAVMSTEDGGKVPEATVHLIDALRVFEDADEVNGKPVTDNLREAIYQIVAEAENKYRTTQRNWFTEQYAPEIAERDGHYWRFPYSSVSYALIAYELNRFVSITDEQAIRTIRPLMTGAVKPENRWQQFIEAHDAVEGHFTKVLETIESGTFTDDDGNEPLHVEKLDEGITIDISPIIAALGSEGYESIDIFGNWDPPIGSVENDEPREEGVYYEDFIMPEGWYTGSWHLVKGPTKDEDGNEVTAYALVDNHDIVNYFDPTEYFGFVYLTMYALVTRMHCHKSIRAIVYPSKRSRKTRNITTKTVVMPNDTITNAFFERGANTIQPWDYFHHDKQETALSIVTGSKGKGIKTFVVINPGEETTIDQAVDTYRLSPEDRFWLEAICSLARDGYKVIRGSDILKFNGFSNPYRKNSTKENDVMNNAYTSIRKMWRLRIAINTTGELKGYKGLAEAYDERPIVDCNWRLLRFDDGSFDFEIILNTTNDGTALGALPLAVYAKDKKQLLFAERTDFDFKTLRGLRLESRLMWRYVLRRMYSKTMKQTIVFDTIFKNIGLEDIDRQKRSSMLATLHRMLDERRSQGVLTFAWNKKGRSEYSVTIKATPRIE